jgi:hypothetical protein
MVSGSLVSPWSFHTLSVTFPLALPPPVGGFSSCLAIGKETDNYGMVSDCLQIVCRTENISLSIINFQSFAALPGRKEQRKKVGREELDLTLPYLFFSIDSIQSHL